jgi:intein-encoded DNA endonuclease-like protein
LYLDALELGRSTEWSHRRIAEELQRRYGIRVPEITVYFWITGRSNPIGRWNVFDPKPSRELAYVLGVMKGDGFRTTDHPQGKEEIRLRVRDHDFAEHFNRAVACVLERERPNRIRIERRADEDGATFFHARYSSVQLAEVLDRDFNQLRPIVEGHPGDFLQGFYDSDGSASPDLHNGKLSLKVQASNTNPHTLSYSRNLMMDKFGIASFISSGRAAGYSSLVYGKIVTKRKDSYFLTISGRESVRTFSKAIGFSIRRKQCVLDDGLGLLDRYGSRGAALRWPDLYERTGRRWTRRESAPRCLGSKATPS